MPTASILSGEVGRLLAEGDYYGALRCLNGSTPHRFTALYKREGDRAWNVLLFDAKHPYTPQFPEVAASETYCSMAMAGRQVFVVEDALADERLYDHAARDVIRSYCGAPLTDESGVPFGSLCHFDFEPVATPAGAVELVVEIAGYFGAAAATEALSADVARRMQNLARTLEAFARDMVPGEAWAPIVDELAEPLRPLLVRLPESLRLAYEADLADMRSAPRARYSVAAGRSTASA